MITRYRFILLVSVAATMLLTLAGCGGAEIAGQEETSLIMDTDLALQLQYVDDQTEGPMYDLTLTVPDEWVGVFETKLRGNRITFEFVVEDEVDEDEEAEEEDEDAEDRRHRASIFFIEALSLAQYWEQIGSYPGDYINMINTPDTYFIYHLPQFAFYSGLSDEEFAAFAEAVPAITQSLTVERAD